MFESKSKMPHCYFTQTHKTKTNGDDRRRRKFVYSVNKQWNHLFLNITKKIQVRKFQNNPEVVSFVSTLTLSINDMLHLFIGCYSSLFLVVRFNSNIAPITKQNRWETIPLHCSVNSFAILI